MDITTVMESLTQIITERTKRRFPYFFNQKKITTFAIQKSKRNHDFG